MNRRMKCSGMRRTCNSCCIVIHVSLAIDKQAENGTHVTHALEMAHT